MLFAKKIANVDRYLIASFIIGALPVVFFTHIIPVDFSGFYFQAVSFLKHHEYAYQFIKNYCDNPINSGLNARAPLIPFFMSISMAVFGQNLLGAYLPFALIRLLITPITYLAARQFLPKRLAFVAALLLIFIPRLQTYSFAAPEADVFVAFLYALALLMYAKSKSLTHQNYSILTGISLGLAALAKSTGLSIMLGFLLAVVLSKRKQLADGNVRNNLIKLVAASILCIGPYLLWTFFVHHQLYITTQHDRSLFYIPINLPSLLYTLPIYFGLNFEIGLKAFVVSTMLLSLVCIGCIRALKQKKYELLFPTLVTLILISMLGTCVIGGAIAANLEFITILGFSMIAVSILFILGAETVIGFLSKVILRKKNNLIIANLFILILMFKFINNYFSARYALDFVPQEYYVTLQTIMFNKTPLPNVVFVMENGLRMFKGPVIHQLIREQFQANKFSPFSPLYQNTVLMVTLVFLGLWLFDKPKS